MQNKFDYYDVTSGALEFLENRLMYKYVTLRHYRSRWSFVKEYMESQKIDFISPAVCKNFLINLYNNRSRSDLSVNEKYIEKAVSVLSEFIETGAIQKKKKTTHLDGVPREIKSDNQKACVDRWEAGQPVFNSKYLEFATYYRFRPLTITPGRPRENLKIERPFYYLEKSFLNGR